MRRILIGIMLLLAISASGVIAADTVNLAEAIERLSYFEKQIYAVMNDMEMWIGWNFDDKLFGQKSAAKALQDLSVLKSEILSFDAPLEVAGIKDMELKEIDRLEKIYAGIHEKDEDRISAEFKWFYELGESYAQEIGEIVKKYSRHPKFPKGFDNVSEEAALAGQAGDRANYKKAVDRIKKRDYAGAAKMLEEMLPRCQGTPFEDCVKVRLSDCFIKEDAGSVMDPARGMRLLKETMDSDRYSPVMYEAFLRWRTGVQAAEYGMTSTSQIPNMEYNKKRWQLIGIIQKHLLDHPDDNWAMNQINLFINLPNIERAGKYGNSNLNYYSALYMAAPENSADKSGNK